MVVMGEETSTARSQFIWIDLSAIWLQPPTTTPVPVAHRSSSHLFFCEFTQSCLYKAIPAARTFYNVRVLQLPHHIPR